MIVPNCPVTGMTVEGRRVSAVQTRAGTVPVPEDGRVVLAAGTIESTRLALLAFGDAAGGERIGSNLMAHLRSNFTARIQVVVATPWERRLQWPFGSGVR